MAYIVLGVGDEIVNPILRGENRRLILRIPNDLLSQLFGSFRSHSRQRKESRYGTKEGVDSPIYKEASG
jgi:hypothetical protein